MKKLFKKVIVVWGENKSAVEIASHVAINGIRGGAGNLAVQAYGLPVVKADPDTDPQGDPSVREICG